MTFYKIIALLFVILAAFNFFVWREIFAGAPNSNDELYFFDVGQGDGEMIKMAGNVKVLIDAGPSNKILEALSRYFPFNDRYIDLAILSHPQYDHYAGFIEVFKRYQVGAFIFNGHQTNSEAFRELLGIARQRKIPIVILGEGDAINYREERIKIIFPAQEYLSARDLNDTMLVCLYETNGLRALFTGDLGANLESYLYKKYDLRADVLKVGHHGSKYSSSQEFLKNISPKIAVIEVGKNNYGHPTREALARLADVGARIFRTDQNGTIKITIQDQKLHLFKER